jgi:hypothetical protein
MDESDLLRLAILDMRGDEVARLTSSLRYRATRARCAGRDARAAWHDALADLVAACRGLSPGQAPAAHSAPRAMLDGTALLPERELVCMIVEYENVVADFEGHRGGALLRWGNAVLAVLRHALVSRRHGTRSATAARVTSRGEPHANPSVVIADTGDARL